MRGYRKLIYNLASQGGQGGSAAGDKLKAHFSVHLLWSHILKTDPLARREITAETPLQENTLWSLGEFLGRLRAPYRPRWQETRLRATNSPSTEAASSCRLRGVSSPQVSGAAAPAAAGPPGSAAWQLGRQRLAAPHRARESRHGAALPSVSQGWFSFRPSPLSSGYYGIYLYQEE